MKRKIIEPYWGNKEKTQIICQFHYENGPIQTAAVTDTIEGNPDWKEIHETFTLEEIDKNTESLLAEVKEENEKIKQLNKDEIERARVDSLFNCKIQAFEIDIIKNSKNKELKSRIRKSKNIFEVTAFTAALIAVEHEK